MDLDGDLDPDLNYNVGTRAGDPDPGGKMFQIKTEKGKEIANNCTSIQFLE